jgi:ABC-type uncharacterized transport system ATPase component
VVVCAGASLCPSGFPGPLVVALRISVYRAWIIDDKRVFIGYVGQTGLGKSTLINTIFASHLMDSKGRFTADEPVRQTTEIQAVSHGAFFLLPVFPSGAFVTCIGS